MNSDEQDLDKTYRVRFGRTIRGRNVISTVLSTIIASDTRTVSVRNCL